ncbi:hypothetical protein ACM6RJ_10440, partial [Trueperella pyogenes]
MRSRFSSFRTCRPPISRGRPIRPSGYRVPTFIRTCTDECGRCSDKVDNQGNENNVSSAIGFLEKQFKVGYDQAKTADTFGVVKNMLPKNHHAKSAAHYPDFIGLIASICNQFTDSSTFFD